MSRFQRTIVDSSECELHDEGLMHNAEPMKIDGVPFFPAVEVRFGRALSLRSNDLVVQVDMMAQSPIGNRLGMFVHMTPDAARAMAGALLKQAAAVEEHVAAIAAAAIDKARKQ